MHIKEFLLTEKATLPKKRQNGEDFLDFLRKSFEEFITELLKVENSDLLTNKVLEQSSSIRELSDVIVRTVGEYYKGRPDIAFSILSSWLSKNKELICHLQSIRMDVSEFERTYLLFRMRSHPRPGLSPEEMFHIPFEQRHKVSTQRFSIPGYPCLYLGGSTYICWKEMRCPPLDNVYFVRLKPTKNLELLDIAYTPSILLSFIDLLSVSDKKEFLDFASAHIVLWPLKCACMIQSLYDDAPFKAEYIIPQLLLQYTREDPTIDGIRYCSVHTEQLKNPLFQGFNYAFPVKTQATSGLCNNLKNLFQVTEVIPWQNFSGTTGFPLSPREPNFNNAVIEIVRGNPVLYKDTIYGLMDTYGLKTDTKSL